MTVNGTDIAERARLNARSLGRLLTDYDIETRRAKVPNGVRVECDGAQPYWLELEQDYKLCHSGDDWVVKGGSWGWARLTSNGSPLVWLPTDRGELSLDRHATYLVVPLDHIGYPAAWELSRVTS